MDQIISVNVLSAALTDKWTDRQAGGQTELWNTGRYQQPHQLSEVSLDEDGKKNDCQFKISAYVYWRRYFCLYCRINTPYSGRVSRIIIRCTDEDSFFDFKLN